MERKHSYFNQEHDLLRQSVREFAAKEIAPNIEEWEEAGEMPIALMKRFGDLGMLGLRMPEEYGGASGDYWSTVAFLEELTSSGSSGLMTRIAVHMEIVMPALLHFGTETQKQKYLMPSIRGEMLGALAVTEPEAGSDVASIKTFAEKRERGYNINGNKTFITNGACADYVVLAAKTDKSETYRGISQFIVESDCDGFEVSRKLDKVGLRTSDTAELFFTDMLVPEENLLGVLNNGFYQIMSNFQPERLLIAVGAVAAMEKALSMTLEYVRQRNQFGKPLMSFQVIAHRMAEMFTELEASRELTYRACDMYNRGLDCMKEVLMAKWFTTETANRVAYSCQQLFGGYGYMMEYPIQRVWRDLRVMTIVGGTTEIMKEVISRNL